MERVSDEELYALFVFYKPFRGSIAQNLELALTELRERREQEKAQLSRITQAVDDGMATYHKSD
jgi:hypothetical protein